MYNVEMHSILKVLLILNITIISACSGNGTGFRVINPKSSQELWVKHKNLPAFDKNIHSDGCSGGMSALYAQLTFLHEKHGSELQWRSCCEEHDKAYYYGGSKEDKKTADAALKSCVNNVIGTKFLGNAMQIAVKLGGGPYLPTSYRWGYGEDFNY